MVTAVSLFTGCGGSDAGLVASGVDVLFANDVMEYARETYLANHPETDYLVKTIKDVKSFPKADLLVGCYPCQGISQGGRRDPSDEKNFLFREFSRALGTIKPKAFIVENVSGMVRKNYKNLLDAQIRSFRSRGYKVSCQVLNAANFGVAQDRKRIFIVGIRSDFGIRFEFPTPTHGEGYGSDFVTIREAIGDMPIWPEGEYYSRDFHWYYLSRDRRRCWNETSKTIVANPRHMPLHPVSPKLRKLEHNVWRFEEDSPARRFSYKESARLQGFNNNFLFPRENEVSLEMKYKVVGNAVPPALFNAIYRSIPNIW